MINNGFKIGEKVHIIGTEHIGKIEHVYIDSQKIEVSGSCSGEYKIEELELLDNRPIYFYENGKIERWFNDSKIKEILNKKLYYNYGHYAGFSEKDMDYYIENKIYKTLTIRQILDYYANDDGNLNYWSKNKEHHFSKEEILKYYYSSKEDTEESDSATEDGYSIHLEEKDYHMKRIVYFMRHPEYIKDIATFVEYSIGKKYYDIIDGMHRLIAGFCLCLDDVESIVLNEEIDKLRGYRNKI